MEQFIARLKVVLHALETLLSVLSIVLTVFITELVPLLPDNVAVRVGAFVVAALAWVAALIKVIQKLTRAVPGSEGLILPAGVEVASHLTKDGLPVISVTDTAAGRYLTTPPS